MINEIVELKNEPIVKMLKDVRVGELFKLDNCNDDVFMKVALEGVTGDDYNTKQVGHINIKTGLGYSFEDINDDDEKLRECYLYDGEITITRRLK